MMNYKKLQTVYTQTERVSECFNKILSRNVDSKIHMVLYEKDDIIIQY